MSTKAKKPTVKSSEAIEKAKKIEEQVARYAEQLQKKHGNFRSVPGFSKYEISADGNCLRSRETGKVQQVPNGKKKYLIFNDKGERRSIGKDEIIASLPAAAKATATPKAKAAKNEPTGREGSKKSQIVAMYNEGKTAKEIAEATGFKYNSVYIMLRGYITLEMFKKLEGKYTKSEIIKTINEKTGYTKAYIEWRITK
jgi:hypothetical protein